MSRYLETCLPVNIKKMSTFRKECENILLLSGIVLHFLSFYTARLKHSNEEQKEHFPLDRDFKSRAMLHCVYLQTEHCR